MEDRSGREVRVVQLMYKSRETGVKVQVGLHQGSAFSSFLFAVMERLTDEVRPESLWTLMFADDTVICSESLERRMKVRRQTECMCVNLRQVLTP